MKRKTTLIILSVVILLITTQALYYSGYSNRAGAPIGRTGSPFDNGGIACSASGCHTGFAVTPVTGWITSNIPGTGYVTGNTYTITATATFTGLVRYGFEISAQDSIGAQAGTNVITNIMLTRLAGTSNPKYVTHTTMGTDASASPGVQTWTFDWIAPPINRGTVTFYGAFNCTNNSNSVAGDRIFLSQHQVTPDFTSGWNASENKLFAFDVYPNPATEKCELSVIAQQHLIVQIALIDITGKIIKKYADEEISSGIKVNTSLDLSDVLPGIYFLLVNSNENRAVKKVIVL